MKRKIFSGLLVMVLAFTLTAGTAFAAVIDYDSAETVTWGVNGGAGVDEYIIKLQETDVAPEVAATITVVDVTYEIEADLFQPQLVINSEKGGWNQFDIEIVEQGTVTYSQPTNNKLTADSAWNELWIKSGWKSEGAVSLVSVEFKDASGTVIYSLGGSAPAAEATAEATAETTADATPSSTSVPKTGAMDFTLLYGLGAVVSGAVVLKRKKK